MNLSKNYIRQLADYIKRNLKKGYTEDSLKWALVNQGHSKIEVEKAMHLVNSELVAEAPVLETKPEIKFEVVEPKQEEKKKGGFWKNFFRNFKVLDTD